MKELVTLLPEIILYIVLGSIFIRVYRFTRTIKNSTDYYNILSESLISGFILRNLFGLIPLNLGTYIDTIGMIISSIIIGYSAAKIIESDRLNKLRKVLKIKQTFNQYIWSDIIDKDAATYISVEDKENHVVTDGMLVLYESYARQPIIQLAEFRQYNDEGIINDFSDKPERTILIDTSKYNDIVITYEKGSNKVQRWDD